MRLKNWKLLFHISLGDNWRNVFLPSSEEENHFGAFFFFKSLKKDTLGHI